MYFVYSLLLTLGFIILLPRFVIDAFRNGKYVTGLRQRLGSTPEVNSNGKPVVWLHCVSVGEVLAARSLVRAIANRFPHVALVISTTTITGQQVARESLSDSAAAVFYFPIDWAWTVRRVLQRIQPAAILVMETELWPNLFRLANKHDIPVAVLNGRISDKSFGRYKLVRPFIRRVLRDLTIVAMQSERDAARIRELGMSEDRIRVSGNLKFDSAAVDSHSDLTAEIRERFDFYGHRPLIVAASTHHSEERTVLDAFKLIRQWHPDVRLLIAPRHPERFNEVAALLSKSKLAVARRSASPAPADARADVVLLDSIGELRAVYPLAQVAFVGGSILPRGGHSVIEPAALGVCIITGSYMHNFADATEALLKEEALIQLHDMYEPTADLAARLNEVLSDDARRQAIGQRARTVCDRNRGATDRTLDMITDVLSEAPIQSEKGLPFSRLHATAAK